MNNNYQQSITLSSQLNKPPVQHPLLSKSCKDIILASTYNKTSSSHLNIFTKLFEQYYEGLKKSVSDNDQLSIQFKEAEKNEIKLKQQIDQHKDEKQKIKELENKLNDVTVERDKNKDNHYKELKKLSESNQKIISDQAQNFQKDKDILIQQQTEQIKQQRYQYDQKHQQQEQIEQKKSEKLQKQLQLQEQKHISQLMQNQQLEEEQKQQAQEIQQLHNKLQQLDSHDEKIKQFNEQFFNHFKVKGESKYDIQILYKGLVFLKQGVKIQSVYGDKLKYLDIEAKLVGFLGNFNTGKTYLLSLLSDRNLKQGLNYKTEGFNIVYKKFQENNVFMIDTAGTGEPQQIYDNLQLQNQKYYSQQDIIDSSISNQNDEQQQQKGQEIELLLQQQKTLKEEMQKEEEKINSSKQKFMLEQIMAEKFAQTYIFNNCHLIILVVGILNREDEKMIYHISNLFKTKPNKEIIIVHNFQNLVSMEQVKEKIQKDIMNCFYVKNKPQVYNNKLCDIYEDYSYGSEKPISHLILALDKTPAGDYYNEATKQCLLYKIASIASQSQQVHLLNDIQKYFNDNCHHFLKIKNNLMTIQPSSQQGQQASEEKNKKEQNFDFGYKEQDGELYLVSQQLQNQNDEDIRVREVPFDYFGQINSSSFQSDITPDYSIWEHSDYIRCEIDLPGIQNKDIKVKIYTDHDTNAIWVKLEAERSKLNEQQYEQKQDQTVNNIKYGKFQLNTTLYNKGSILNLKSKKFEFVDNVLRIKILKENQNNEEYEQIN